MKKKKILLILLFILITTFGLMPKAKAKYYNAFARDNDNKFFNVKFDGEEPFYIWLPRNFQNLANATECKVNGTNCIICDHSNYRKKGYGRNYTKKQAMYMNYTDFKYYINHYSTIFCWGHNEEDQDDTSNSRTEKYHHNMVEIIDLDENKIKFNSNNKEISFQPIEDDSKRSNELTAIANMEYLCWMATAINNKRPIKYTGNNSKIINVTNTTTKKIDWTAAVESAIGNKDKKIQPNWDNRNIVFFEPQMCIWGSIRK